VGDPLNTTGSTVAETRITHYVDVSEQEVKAIAHHAGVRIRQAAADNADEELSLLLGEYENEAGLIAGEDNTAELPPLHVAASNDADSVVALLLRRGANPNQLTAGTRSSPLFFAAERASDRTLQALLLRGADCNLRNKAGYTPLHVACQSGNVAAVRRLLASGADPNQSQNVQKWTPLHVACRSGHAEVVRLLLELEVVDPEASDEMRRQPLHWAAYSGSLDCVMALVETAGCQVEPLDSNYTLPATVAHKFGNEEVYAYLQGRAHPGLLPGSLQTVLEDEGEPDNAGESERLPLRDRTADNSRPLFSEPQDSLASRGGPPPLLTRKSAASGSLEDLSRMLEQQGAQDGTAVALAGPPGALPEVVAEVSVERGLENSSATLRSDAVGNAAEMPPPARDVWDEDVIDLDGAEGGDVADRVGEEEDLRLFSTRYDFEEANVPLVTEMSLYDNEEAAPLAPDDLDLLGKATYEVEAEAVADLATEAEDLFLQLFGGGRQPSVAGRSAGSGTEAGQEGPGGVATRTVGRLALPDLHEREVEHASRRVGKLKLPGIFANL
jgi:ankyrin repeat protein